jgi:hypothetical protein
MPLEVTFEAWCPRHCRGLQSACNKKDFIVQSRKSLITPTMLFNAASETPNIFQHVSFGTWMKAQSYLQLSVVSYVV